MNMKITTLKYSSNMKNFVISCLTAKVSKKSHSLKATPDIITRENIEYNFPANVLFSLKQRKL